jgi:outer membrane lipoprotein LolB
MRRIFASLLAIIVLAGCASPQPLPSRPPLAEITAFAFNGRLAVRQGEIRHYVKIDWRHAPAHDAILLATPLGQGVAEIERDAAGARLTLADQRRFVADDWGSLSEQVFGFRLPLQASARWLLGEAPEVEGWRVSIIEREAAGPDALPTVIELERDDIHVRLKIDEWSEVR